jgi:hypothetical protein
MVEIQTRVFGIQGVFRYGNMVAEDKWNSTALRSGIWPRKTSIASIVCIEVD